MEPLVSILIPAYNSQEWIGDTLRSALAQTWTRKEIILVDDGSKDQTLAIARQFEPSGVRVVTQQNQGAAAARNTALSLSQGDYIQWLDADDLLSPGKIAAQMELAAQALDKKTLFSCPWGRFMYRHCRAEFIATPLWSDLSPADWLVRKMGQNLHMQTATWLVSRELTETAGPWDPTMYTDDDGEYFCRVLLASDGVRFVPDGKVYYRASGSGSVSYIGGSNRKLDAQWRSMQLHVTYLLSLENSARTRTACLTYLQTWFSYFYPNRLDIVSEIERLAGALGGHTNIPQLSWKYSWIKSLLGWNAAKRAQMYLPRARWSVARTWDKFLNRIQAEKTSQNSRAHP